jgi:hypothetical protein
MLGGGLLRLLLSSMQPGKGALTSAAAAAAPVSAAGPDALRLGSWSAHPLSAALLVSPAAAAALVGGALEALCAAAAAVAAASEAAGGSMGVAQGPAAGLGGPGGGSARAQAALDGAWACLEGFLSFVLLQVGTGGVNCT